MKGVSKLEYYECKSLYENREQSPLQIVTKCAIKFDVITEGSG